MNQVVLSIGGFDPSAGAGVLADIKTFKELNVWGLAVPTTITNQSSLEFLEFKDIDKDFFYKSLKLMFNTYKIDGVKVGLLTNSYQLDIILDFIKKYKVIFLLDPVISSSTGFNFWNEDMVNYVRNNLINFDVITPNFKEGLTLLNEKNDSSELNPETLAKKLYAKYRVKVALTGGDTGTDVFYDGKDLYSRNVIKINKPGHIKHGTGCVFSSSVLASMVKGDDFISSCVKASQIVENAINKSYNFSNSLGGLRV